jgi:hypothetical protein
LDGHAHGSLCRHKTDTASRDVRAFSYLHTKLYILRQIAVERLLLLLLLVLLRRIREVGFTLFTGHYGPYSRCIALLFLRPWH